MLKNKNSLLIMLGVAVVSVGILSIAFAALSQTLNITHGNVTQNALTWNVGFVAGTYTGTPSGTSSTGRSCGNITATRNTLTVANTTLSKPGDACSYAIPITNDGDLNAYLESLIYTEPTSTSCIVANAGGNPHYGAMTCGNITYRVTTDDMSLVFISSENCTGNNCGDPFAQATLIVSYTGTSLNSTTVTQKNAKITFNYSDDYTNSVFNGNEWFS